MRESVVNKYPFTLILGQKEVDGNLISYRKHSSDETITLSKDEFVKLLLDNIKNKRD